MTLAVGRTLNPNQPTNYNDKGVLWLVDLCDFNNHSRNKMRKCTANLFFSTYKYQYFGR